MWLVYWLSYFYFIYVKLLTCFCMQELRRIWAWLKLVSSVVSINFAYLKLKLNYQKEKLPSFVFMIPTLFYLCHFLPSIDQTFHSKRFPQAVLMVLNPTGICWSVVDNRILPDGNLDHSTFESNRLEKWILS